ncbi:endonuclease [Shewanella colwelliana]|uniref:endonuclease n=1 Tax=Shewanella colwelliana TaxID=23 RepID=UPI00299D115A|nr:endonuclease [Shewanella colwelliana]MDX1283149.1 endonuclease [Shewanella colwelliana]
MRIKMSAVATATAMVLGAFSTAASADLLITEYIEGGGFNKAIELYNSGDSAQSLSGYKLVRYKDGATTTTDMVAFTDQEIPAKGILVVRHTDAVLNLDASVTEMIGGLQQNGTDAVALLNGDTVVDIVGAVPTPKDWGKDVTLRRSDTTSSMVAKDTFDESDWTSHPKDTVDGFGCIGENACSFVAEPGVLLITEYIEGSANNKAIEISNVGGSAIDLDANVYQLAKHSNGAVDAGDAEILSGTLEPGKSIVFHNSDAADEFKVGTESKVTWFNGDDAMVLTKDGAVIDSIGKVGERVNWKDGDFSTVDATLRRKDSVKVGDTDTSDTYPGTSKDQWLVLPKDTSDGLNCAGESACDGSVTPPEPPKPETGPCTGCETLTPVADPATFNGEIYYSDVLSGEFANAEELKNALSVIIAKDHKQLTYKQVWSTLTYADQDPSDDKKVIEIYTGASISKYDNQTSGSGVGKWNREHVWAKSHGFPSESQWGYTDAHHLRPSDPGINTARSNNDFGACKDTGEEVMFNGVGTGNYLNKTTDCWEPRDEVKGDVARMIMYMDTRYQGTDTATTNMPDLVAVDRLTTTDEDSAPLIGTLCTLYAWNQLDAVDAYEQNRNNQVYKYQGNRNPFIDRPELVKEVYGAVCGDDPNPALEVEGDILAPESVTEGTAYTLDASAIKAGEGVTLTYKWEQIVGEEKTLVGDTATLSLTAPMVKADETLNFTLTISDGTLETTKAVSVSVINVPLALNVEFAGTTKVTEGEKASITATVADAPEGTTYSWKQVSGTTAVYTATGLTLDVTAPSVNIDQVLVFELMATVGEESFAKSVSIEVTNTEEPGWTKPDGAGSLGGFITLLLPLMWLRRRQG